VLACSGALHVQQQNCAARAGVYVFATGAQEARLAAIDKMADKYLRHQNKRTRWEVTGELVEA
jgi:hypothetical protein